MNIRIEPISAVALLIICSSSAIAEEVADNEPVAPNQEVIIWQSDQFNSKDQVLEHIAELRLTADQSAGQEREDALAALAHALRHVVKGFDTEPNERKALLSESLDAYIGAAREAVIDGRIRYSWEIADLAYELKEKNLLVNIFEELLLNHDDEKGRFVALIDYANGLAKFNDKQAQEYFSEAVRMRNPEDGMEAYYRYAKYLQESDDPESALDVLDQFSEEQRRIFVNVALLRRQIIYTLGQDTSDVDAEIAEIRESLAGKPGLGGIPKLAVSTLGEPRNILGLAKAYTAIYSHTQSGDDSRGPNANSWKVGSDGSSYSRVVVNAAEVCEMRLDPKHSQRSML